MSAKPYRISEDVAKRSVHRAISAAHRVRSLAHRHNTDRNSGPSSNWANRRSCHRAVRKAIVCRCRWSPSDGPEATCRTAGATGNVPLHIPAHVHYVIGPGGTGKSHLAQAIGQAAILQGYKVLYREVHVLLHELADAAAEGTRKDYMQSIGTVPLLVLDDFGMRKLPHTAAEDLLEIVIRRYERFSTLLTSNRLCGAPHNRFWTNPLRGSSVGQPSSHAPVSSTT
jgi:hypothetical protein